MTMPNETPAGSTSPGGANGAENPSGSPDVHVPESTTPGPEEDRAGENRSEENLEEQVRRFQSEKDKLEAKLNKNQQRLGKLSDWLDQLGGGDNVLALVSHLATHPNFRQFVGELNEHGKIVSPLVQPQATNEEDEDEYIDPATKRALEAAEEAKAEAQRLSAQLTQRDSRDAGERFKTTVQGWIERYREDLTDEDIERIREKGDTTVARLGANALNMSPQDINTLMRGTFTDDEWDSLMDRRALRRLQNQQQRGTDSPSSVSVTKTSEDLSQADPRAVWREAVRQIP